MSSHSQSSQSSHAHSASSGAPDLVRVRRALISVSDKHGVVELASTLVTLGVEVVSTGGTFKALTDARVRCTPIEQLTGLPEMMDGRVKTLHPAVHGGLLAVRDNPEHVAALLRHSIEPIDLVCINLYPFTQTLAKLDAGTYGLTHADAVENIDIGGPAMVRSGAKNHAYVAVLTDPAQYPRVLSELRQSAACTTLATRARLAGEAFAMSAAYDAAIAAYMARNIGIANTSVLRSANTAVSGAAALLPERLTISLRRVAALRHGENPHQAAALYTQDLAPNAAPLAVASSGSTIVNATQLHGKELSYNNIADAAAALDLALALAMALAAQAARVSATGLDALRCAACVIKHANPCGAAAASHPLLAVDRAIAGDPVAAFGGILACSATIDGVTAERLAGKDIFLEVIIAPSFTEQALATLRAKSSSCRLLAYGHVNGSATTGTAPSAASQLAGEATPDQRIMFRSIPGGVLVQERDLLMPDATGWTHSAGPAPTSIPGSHTLQEAEIIEVIARALASNAIAIGASDGHSVRLLGAGVGQVDRVTACRLAVEKARAFSPDLLTSGRAIAVSDAFFPFPDGPQILIDAGVSVLVHPGGSKRDAETFELCNQRRVTCMTTGVRRFRH